MPDSGDQLDDQYRRRFGSEDETRRRVWRTLIDSWFIRYVDETDRVLDLGCGWGPFINQISAAERYGIDLNPDAKNHLDRGVTLFEQRADEPWPLDDSSLDLAHRRRSRLQGTPGRRRVDDHGPGGTGRRPRVGPGRDRPPRVHGHTGLNAAPPVTPVGGRTP